MVKHVLTSPRQYGLSVIDVAQCLDPIIAMRGLKLPGKRTFRRALSLLIAQLSLGFEDALIAAKLQLSKMRLLSYDPDFERVPGITRAEP
jgi:predicted nucleic acid-binding protein